MEIIEKLCNKIEDEIDDIKDYAKMAVELKDSYPNLAETLYKISTEEDKHREMLHTAVIELFQNTKNEGKTIPDGMEAFYEYVHKRHTRAHEEALCFQQMYKK